MGLYSDIKKWGAYAALAGTIQVGALEALKLSGKDKHQGNETQNQNESGLIEIEPAVSEGDFEDKVEAAITDENGNIDEKKVRKIDLGMVMLDFLISSGNITLEKGEALKKILATKRAQHREMSKTKNQLEVLHQIIQEHRKPDPAVAGLDDFLENGTGNCQGAATGILAITQGVYPDLEINLQNFTGAYGGHVRLVARIDGQWFSLERSTPTPITLENGTILTPVTEIVKVMAGKNIESKENGTASKPFDGETKESPNRSNPVLNKVNAHDNGAKPTATYDDDSKPTVQPPFKNSTLVEAQKTLATKNPYAAEIATRVAKELQEKLEKTKEKPTTKSAENPTDTREGFKVKLVEKNEEQKVKDSIMIKLHQIMLETKSKEEKQEHLRALFDFVTGYGTIIDELRADKKTKILQYPEVKEAIEYVIDSENKSELSDWQSGADADDVLLLIADMTAFLARSKGEIPPYKRKITTLIIEENRALYEKLPSGEDLDAVVKILERNTADNFDLQINSIKPEQLRFAMELLQKMQHKVREVIIKVDSSSDLTSLEPTFKTIKKDLRIIIKRHDNNLNADIDNDFTILSPNNFSFAANTNGIEIDPDVHIAPGGIPASIRSKITIPIDISSISGQDNDSEVRDAYSMVTSALQGGNLKFMMTDAISARTLDLVMGDARIQGKEINFIINDNNTCSQEILEKLASYDLKSLTIRSWSASGDPINLSVLRGTKAELKFECHDSSDCIPIFDKSTYTLRFYEKMINYR